MSARLPPDGGLAKEVPALINYVDYAWRTGEDGEILVRELARVPEGEVGAPTPAPIG